MVDRVVAVVVESSESSDQSKEEAVKVAIEEIRNEEPADGFDTDLDQKQVKKGAIIVVDESQRLNDLADHIDELALKGDDEQHQNHQGTAEASGDASTSQQSTSSETEA